MGRVWTATERRRYKLPRFPACVTVLRANPHRSPRLVLLALARSILSGHKTHRHVVQSLYGDVQHGGTECALLQLAETGDGERMAAQCSGKLPLLGESEPADYPRETPRSHPDAGERILQHRKYPGREARLFPVSISTELSLRAVTTCQHRSTA